MAREKMNQNLNLNAPDYLAWHVTNRNDKSFWNKVGAAWRHKDGRGYTLQLETCPINRLLKKSASTRHSEHDSRLARQQRG